MGSYRDGRSVGRTVERTDGRTRPPLGEMVVVVVATTIVLWVVYSSEKGGELEEGGTIRREKTTSESETGSCFRNAPLPLSFPFLSFPCLLFLTDLLSRHQQRTITQPVAVVLRLDLAEILYLFTAQVKFDQLGNSIFSFPIC